MVLSEKKSFNPILYKPFRMMVIGQRRSAILSHSFQQLAIASRHSSFGPIDHSTRGSGARTAGIRRTTGQRPSQTTASGRIAFQLNDRTVVKIVYMLLP
uniref:Uncharacterized protein n=1 Tax=Romanomermis culicivorax TaxID=13658 RepID=A0A915L4N3_ROMCU